MKSTKHRNTAGLKPFKKGDDSRRWKHGQKSKAAVAQTRDLQDWLAKIGEEIVPDLGQTYNEAIVRKLYNRAVKGDMQATGMILDRILGKAVQPLSGNLTLSGKLSIAEMRRSAKEAEDGSGN